MNNERMSHLFTYLDGLTKLTTNEFRCNTEITECIGWIREEFTKEPSGPQDIVEFRGFTGFIDKGRNGND